VKIVRKAILVFLPFLFTVFILVGVFSITSATQASPAQTTQPVFDGWVITAVFSESAVAVINTMDHTVHGPFLAGELGSPYSLLDIVVTPDGSTALVSNFSNQAVYYLDVSNPIAPSVITSVTIPFFAEDIALSHDGRYAVVTDGGFTSMVATLDVITPSLVFTANLGTNYAQAVDVAPDGTVVLVNYSAGTLTSLLLDASGTLSHTHTYTQLVDGNRSFPLNVNIAPDGQTVLVSNFYTDAVGVYQIISPGVLTQTGMLHGLPGDQQSIAFSPAGDQAFVLSVVTTPTDQVSVLDILGPGQVSLNAAGVANLKSNAFGGFFGVDVLAVAGGRLYAGNPSSSGMTETLTVVDLYNWGVTGVPIDDYPIGVAVIPPRRIFLPTISN
jgi:DNA-binding beta-propeller fold protein YncE